MLLQRFFSRLIKIAFNKLLCGKYFKRLHNNILRPKNKPINDSNLLVKSREFPSTRAFLQQTNISAKIFPETLRIPTNNSKQTNILYQIFSINNIVFCSKLMLSIKSFPLTIAFLQQTNILCQNFPFHNNIFRTNEYSLSQLFLKNQEFPPMLSTKQYFLHFTPKKRQLLAKFLK